VRDGDKVRRITPARSQRLWNHSDGFEYGYGGSGPAQLALAILLDFLNDKERAVKLHQRFKFHFIGRIGDPGGTVTEREIAEWIAGH
jgi:hypothetical protein